MSTDLNAMSRSPLVSVIIPMYNSAKFIPQTLESLTYQTMKDFEVVVIDDCSTDNSVEVVENFANNVGGGLSLNIIKLQEHTGKPGLPRNVGIKSARGKYLAFLDSDDLYIKTALEELTTLAEEYQAEVVSMCNWFALWNNKGRSVEDPVFSDMNELMNPANWTPKSEKGAKLISAPKFESENIAERVNKFISNDTFWTSWLSFYRRDFIITNQNFFPPMITSEDASFVFGGWCLAKKFLRVPNRVYIRRPRAGSIGKEISKNIDVKDYFHKRISSFVEGTKSLDSVMNKVDFFKENPSARHDVLNFFYRKNLYYCFQMPSIYAKNSAFELSELVKKEINSECSDFTAYLFGEVVRSHKSHSDDLKVLSNLAPYINARIDVLFVPGTNTGDFQIVSVSDNKAKKTKPAWLQKNGIGYVINSYVGKLAFVVKSTVDGQIKLSLRGNDIHEPENKKKRIPYWIDYTKLTVNGQSIFDTLTPTWHNKPYRYNTDIKTGEKIIIEVTWLPHRSDT